MTTTRRSVLLALVLAGGSLLVAFGRWSLAGADPYAMRAADAWQISLVVVGAMESVDATVTTPIPPDFRNQHIYDEQFHSKELLTPVDRGADPHRHEVVWRRAVPAGPAAFRLTYSFHCTTTGEASGSSRRAQVHPADAVPDDAARKASAKIQSDHKEIVHRAQELVAGTDSPLDQIRALFEFVDALENEPTFGVRDALHCLHHGGGDPAAKSRLLVALCRSRGIPARLVHGLILTTDQEQGTHLWAEAWVNDRWLPMCPTHHHFDGDFPRNYLVLCFGDDDCVRGHAASVQHRFLVRNLHGADAASAGGSALSVPFWEVLSLHALRPADQSLVKFLLLLPVGAVIVSIYRTVIGVPTFGTFTPALLGLAFLDWKALPGGMGIIFVTVMLGWGLRHALDRFHLLMVPRLAILLTMIVTFLILIVGVASRFGIPASHYLALFPLVILTHMVERFGTMESDEGTPASFRALLGTFLVAVTISLVLGPGVVGSTLLAYPELLGLAVAVQFLLGRYTGYRLSELYRFRCLINDGPSSGDEK